MENTIPDIYADGSRSNVGAFGAALLFHLSAPTGPAPDGSQPKVVAVIRTSLEHMKVMVFQYRRSIMEYEKKVGVPIPIAPQVREALNIPQEDWEVFWK